MKNFTIYEKCPKCGKLFSHRKGEITDEVNLGCCRGQDGIYCTCGGKLEDVQISDNQL
jgi:hypothetical protein